MKQYFARTRPAALAIWLAALCWCAALTGAQAQVSITEAMTSASSISNGVPVLQWPDYWELTNFGNDPTNLTGWSWGDNQTSGLTEIFDGLTVTNGESVIFYRANRPFSPDDFRKWWGLPDTVRVFPYVRPGLSHDGDRVHMSDADGNLVQSVQMGLARTGVSFVYDTNTGVFGVFSEEGVGCAFRAATGGDVGSPGCTAGPVPPFIIGQPMSQEVDVCQEATFSVLAGGVPAPRYQWWFKSEASEEPISGATSSTFSIINAQPADAGQYWAVIGNFVGTVTSQVATLTVNTNPHPPTIAQPPKDASVFDGQTARFTVGARGYPCLSYQWRSNAVDLPGATSRTLIVPDVSPGQSGTLYSVVVSNALGVASASASLRVTPKPNLIITEVMPLSDPNSVIDRHDWWELTNYDTNSVNLQGWRAYDTLQEPDWTNAFVIPQPVIIRPGESVVFAEQTDPQGFAAWWGATNLPPGLQVVTYHGFGLSEWGEELYLWNPSAEDPLNYAASAQWWRALSGVSMYFVPPDILPHDSVAGTNCAFAAVETDDVGSPGFALGTNPRFLRITRDASGATFTWQADCNKSYCLQFTSDLRNPTWQNLGTYSAVKGLITFTDRNANGSPQGFYRLQEGSCSP